MRSSKSRSRNKSRNQRSLGNVVNRVFDSSGPEGKVRGTPQQIIEKYLALARDAQLSGDRVAEQSFLQHAEHYTRMLGEAQREQAERQAQFGAQGQYGDDRGDDRQGGQDNHTNGNGRDQSRPDNRGDQNRPDNRSDARNDRDDRRGDDRHNQRRDDRGDRRDRPARDEQPEFSLGGEGHDALPDFLKAPIVGIPEALSIDDEPSVVETPEAREAVSRPLPEPSDECEPAENTALDQAAEAEKAPRPRRCSSPGTAAAPRRVPRKRNDPEDAPEQDE